MDTDSPVLHSTRYFIGLKDVSIGISEDMERNSVVLNGVVLSLEQQGYFSEENLRCSCVINALYDGIVLGQTKK
jgi:hypothetical protein